MLSSFQKGCKGTKKFPYLKKVREFSINLDFLSHKYLLRLAILSEDDVQTLAKYLYFQFL